MMSSNQDTENPCPCGSGEAYLDCCGPCHTHHKTPETAEALMRSRYAAYVLQDWDYLHQSWHPSTRPPLAVLRQGPHPDWTGLEIVRTGMAKGPDEAFVEFRARYRDGTHARVLHETSRFVRELGYWQYVDGKLDPETQSPGIKVGRNQACPCGSGRKFKHCCGC